MPKFPFVICFDNLINYFDFSWYLDVDLPMFDGHCLDSSDESIPTGEAVANDIECQLKCIETEGCTAFSFTSTTLLCTLFSNGPYTQGDGTANTKCYTMNPGIFDTNYISTINLPLFNVDSYFLTWKMFNLLLKGLTQ